MNVNEGRRSSLEINADILRVIGRGEERPSRVMHLSNLSWRPLQGRLDHLKDAGLITIEEIGVNVDGSRQRRLSLTEGGKEWIDNFMQLVDAMNMTRAGWLKTWRI